MNIHEYQAKKILKDYGAPVSNGVVIFSIKEMKFVEIETVFTPLIVELIIVSSSSLVNIG